jgi:hypothetical protein
MLSIWANECTWFLSCCFANWGKAHPVFFVSHRLTISLISMLFFGAYESSMGEIILIHCINSLIRHKNQLFYKHYKVIMCIGLSKRSLSLYFLGCLLVFWHGCGLHSCGNRCSVVGLYQYVRSYVVYVTLHNKNQLFYKHYKLIMCIGLSKRSLSLYFWATVYPLFVFAGVVSTLPWNQSLNITKIIGWVSSSSPVCCEP